MDTAVNNENDVMNLQYIQKTKFSLDCIGLWPNKEFGDTSLRSKMAVCINLFLIVGTNTALYGQLMYIKNKRSSMDFMDLGHSVITTLMTIVFIQRLSLPYQKAHCALTKEFVFDFHIAHHKDASSYATQMHEKVNKICALITRESHYLIYAGLSLFNLVPLYKNYSAGLFSANRPANGTYEHAVYYDFPVDQYTDFKYYFIIAFYNWTASYFVIVGFTCFDLLISIFVIHIWGHLSILKNNLECFPKPRVSIYHNYDGHHYSTPWYTKRENEDVSRRLRDLIRYHQMINKFLTATSKAYGMTLCLYLIFHQFTGCVFLLECSSLDPEALVKFGLLTVVIFQQLIQISVIFELIGTKGDTLVAAVYGLPWECMDSRNRGMVMLFLQNVQKHLAVKAGDVFPVGVTTMLGILKASITYCMMLRTVGKDTS